MGGSQTLLDQALTAIREERPSARAMGVELIEIVGSIARGEARADSDVDLIGREAMKPDRWAYMGRDLVVA